MAENEATKRLLRNPTGYWVAAGALAVLGALGFNPNMMVSLVAVPAFLAALLSLIRNLFHGPAAIRNRGLILLAMTLLLAVNLAECRTRTWLLERHLAPVISGLEAYRKAKGFYPDRVDAIVPEFLQGMPRCSEHRPVLYLKNRKGPDGFDLTCVTFGFNKHSYDSVAGAWRDWD